MIDFFSKFENWLNSARKLEESMPPPLPFHIGLYEFFAICAKADGTVSPAEVAKVQSIGTMTLRLTPEEAAEAMAAFHSTLSTDGTLINGRVFRFYWTNRNERWRLFSAMELLIRVALADGAMCSREEDLILEIVRGFGITYKEYTIARKKICDEVFGYTYSSGNRAGGSQSGGSNGRQQSSEKPASQIPKVMTRQIALGVLGCLASSNLQDIKRAYRRLVKQYHHDVIKDGAGSEESRRAAHQKFLDIQRAYEYLRPPKG
jgi:DnaJ like chaperone protein